MRILNGRRIYDEFGLHEEFGLNNHCKDAYSMRHTTSIGPILYHNSTHFFNSKEPNPFLYHSNSNITLSSLYRLTQYVIDFSIQYMVEKEIEKLDDDVTMKSYRTWFDCFSANASVYMPEFLKTMEKKRAEAAADLENKMNETES